METQKPTKLVVPLGFSRVSCGPTGGDGNLPSGEIYRSSYPATQTLPFIKSLGLKTMICLTPSDIKQGLRDFARENGISLLELDVGCNREPFQLMNDKVVSEVVSIMLDSSKHPLLIFCTNGKVRTGCVVGCYRRLQGWALVSIIHEFEQHSDKEGGIVDLIFLEGWG